MVKAVQKVLDAKDKEAYAKIQKELADANAKLAELAKKAEVELPETAEQQKENILKFLAKEKDTIDQLLETDKTDSMSAMRSFNELATKNNININQAPAGRAAMGGFGGAAAGAAAAPATTRNAGTSTIRRIQEKFPKEYAEVQKLRQDDPETYRAEMRKLAQKLNEEEKK